MAEELDMQHLGTSLEVGSFGSSVIVQKIEVYARLAKTRLNVFLLILSQNVATLLSMTLRDDGNTTIP